MASTPTTKEETKEVKEVIDEDKQEGKKITLTDRPIVFAHRTASWAVLVGHSLATVRELWFSDWSKLDMIGTPVRGDASVRSWNGSIRVWRHAIHRRIEVLEKTTGRSLEYLASQIGGMHLCACLVCKQYWG